MPQGTRRRKQYGSVSNIFSCFPSSVLAEPSSEAALALFNWYWQIQRLKPPWLIAPTSAIVCSWRMAESEPRWVGGERSISGDLHWSLSGLCWPQQPGKTSDFGKPLCLKPSNSLGWMAHGEDEGGLGVTSPLPKSRETG